MIEGLKCANITLKVRKIGKKETTPENCIKYLKGLVSKHIRKGT
tara:strand:+ start:79 stop:210 length:132 start_codon:yes stop_codon:yes gene_type:complete